MESASEIKVKSEPVFDFGASQNESSGNGFRQEYSDSDDDIPLAQKLLKRKKQKSFKISSKDAHVDKKPKLANAVLITDNTSDSAKFGESEDDIPLSVLYKKHKVKKDPGISSSISSNDRISEENGIPKKAKKGEKTKSKKPSTSTKTTEPKKKLSSKAKPANSPPGTPKKSTKGSPTKPSTGDDDDDDDSYKWWTQEDYDDSIKWDTLHHNGPVFPPEYCPHGIKMKYDGSPVKLSPASEEIATFFAQVVGTQYAENETFCKNFFNDFMEVLKKHDPNTPIIEFSKCDFTPITKYLEQQRELKKQMTKEEKESIKLEKKKVEDQYGWALIDGRREKIGNFRIEPPGLFRGRGDHPKTGTLKKRVLPEQITLNLSKDAPIPPPPNGHKWGKIVHDNTVAWLATWTENVNGNIKYIMFAANSSLKGMSDFKKFEKARELKNHIKRIRDAYTRELRDKMMVLRQRATAMWLIDNLALRAGNEKGDDEADTVGCCSLRYEHIDFDEGEEDVPDPENPGQTKKCLKKYVIFDFLGKDSIRYYNKVAVNPTVWKNLKIFKREPKKEGDPLFDRLSTSVLNKHLQTLMPGLTAKVFRTFNASYTFQNELKNTPKEGLVAEKILAYNRANRQVAILCNHQRSVSKAHDSQMEKLSEKILTMKYHRRVAKKKMLKLDPKLKKTRPELTEEESDLDEETFKRKEKEDRQEQLHRLEKKYEKMCEKAKEKGQPKPEKPTLKDSTREPNMERLEKELTRLNDRIHQAKAMRIDKDENKTTALGTSKINYIDPRITSAWCAKYEVPIEKMFTKTLREKFKWAMDAGADWQF